MGITVQGTIMAIGGHILTIIPTRDTLMAADIITIIMAVTGLTALTTGHVQTEEALKFTDLQVEVLL